MTTAIRPIGFGEFEPIHRSINEDLTPPPSARLPPIQTQTGNQWSKNIWEYNKAGGSGFGAVARPKDFEDRKSPSLLSPVGTGPSPWTRSAFPQSSPIEPAANNLGVKRTNTLPLATSESHEMVIPSYQSASQLSSKAHITTALSLQTRDMPTSSFYRRPTEINSAQPTYNRMDSFSDKDNEDHTQPERKSLSSWNTPPTGRASRQTSYGAFARHMPDDATTVARRPTRPEQTADFVSDHASWSSSRQQGQRSYSYTASGRQSHLLHEDHSGLESRFNTLNTANEVQPPVVSEPWHSEADSRLAYAMQGYAAGSSSFAQQDSFQGLSHSNWRAEAVPRSFGVGSARQHDSQYCKGVAQATSRSNFQPRARETADPPQQRLQASLDEYPLRQAADGLDTQPATGLVQYDGTAVVRATQHEDLVYFQQFYQHMSQLRAHGFLPSPYSYPPAAYGGLHNISQGPPIMSGQRLLPVTEASSNGLRSQLLEDFLNSMKSNGKRYELREIYNHGVEFSGNQHGSKFIQNKLETATSDEKDRIFSEILPNAIQLMKDIYGNYVIQKFFERGDQIQKTALFNVMSGKIYELSCQIYGCRVVQMALQHVLVHQQAAMVEELKPHVLNCVRDQNGNHVIQVVVKHVPVKYTQFVVDAFIGQVQHLATHPYGCRVVQRLLDHCVEPGRSQILRELHASASTLISDQYGNYVAQHVIEFGSPEDKSKMIALVRQHLIPYSKQKFASNVVERCLKFGSDGQRRDIMLQMVAKGPGDESALPMMIKDSFGNYVIQQLLDRLAPEDYACFVEALVPEVANLRRIVPHNKQVDNVAKKMYKPDSAYNPAQFHHQTPLPKQLEIANPNPLTSGESSPFSTAQPILVDERQTVHYAEGAAINNSAIRIEVTDH